MPTQEFYDECYAEILSINYKPDLSMEDCYDNPALHSDDYINELINEITNS